MNGVGYGIEFAFTSGPVGRIATIAAALSADIAAGAQDFGSPRLAE